MRKRSWVVFSIVVVGDKKQKLLAIGLLLCWGVIQLEIILSQKWAMMKDFETERIQIVVIFWIFGFKKECSVDEIVHGKVYEYKYMDQNVTFKNLHS